MALKERRLKSYRFYFAQKSGETRFLSKEELEQCIIQFMAMSKRNDQQHVIDRLKEDLKRFRF